MAPDPVYLDNAATTAVLPEVVEEMAPYFSRHYGNPASTHVMGVSAARALEAAAGTLAASVGAGEWDTVFTSSGTEANNLALLGYALKHREGRIVTTTLEHASVLETAAFLSQRGFDLVRVAPDRHGMVSARAVCDAASEATLLVSVQHGNNEIGTLQPVEEIGMVLKKVRPRTLLHVDAVQTAGKVDLAGAARWADLMTLSGHKVHGPKGVGALLIRKKAPRPGPLLRGGGQQEGLRSGTENVPGAVGFALAMKSASERLAEHGEHLRKLEEAFEASLHAGPRVRRLFADSARIPGFIVLGFPGIPSEVIEHAMESEGFIVSSTAACSSRNAKRSHVLEAVSCPEELNVIRIVPSRFTSLRHMEEAAGALNAIFERLG
jgi:cysteine desulfurase